MKLNVNIDVKIYEDIKCEAVMADKTVTALTIECVEEYMNNRPDNLKEVEVAEKTVNPALVVPDDFHKRLKLFAIKQHLTMTDIVNNSYRYYLQK